MGDVNVLATKSIKSLLWTYAWPAVISQLIASVYNLVDRIFLGQQVGALAIAGLAITMPVMNVIHAFGSLVGTGACVRMSIVLGRKDYRWAEKILGNTMLLSFFFGFLFLSAGYLFMNPILQLFGASSDTISYARDYMYIVLPGMFFTTLTFSLSAIIRSVGYPMRAMWILVGGALLNIMLDALFIPVLHMGIKGAAWATTVSMFVSACFSVLHFVPREYLFWTRWVRVSDTSSRGEHRTIRNVRTPMGGGSMVNPVSFSSTASMQSSQMDEPAPKILFRKHAWAPKLYIFRNILAIGISPFSMNIAACLVVALLNMQLIRYGGDLAVGANGVVNSASMLVMMLFLGVCQGMQPIAGYNYGAGLNNRLKEVYMLTVKVCLVLGLMGTLCAELFPRAIIRCFTTDEALIQIAIPAMRYLMACAFLIALQVTNSHFFHSIDYPWFAIVTSLSRQILFLIPAIFIIPQLLIRWFGEAYGLTGVWASCTICDVLGTLLSVVLLLTQRKVFRPGYIAPERKLPKERGPRCSSSVSDSN
ncbi:MAG: MATE family efflux transporter [Bacteroidales bacterium]|nr:MATE family efflux transporter [Candidatus Colimorpha onthohippi]